MSNEVRTTVSRREFIRTAAGATGVMSGTLPGAAATQTSLSAAPVINPRVIGANDRIHVGIIGVKGMGGGHLRNLVGGQMKADNVDVIAVCDVWERRNAKRTRPPAAPASTSSPTTGGSWKSRTSMRSSLRRPITGTVEWGWRRSKRASTCTSRSL